jgi:hypothetical protein
MMYNKATRAPFEPAGGDSDRHAPRSRLLGRRTIIARFGALGGCQISLIRQYVGKRCGRMKLFEAQGLF